MTHSFDSLDHVNDAVHAMHEGSCLRSIITCLGTDSVPQLDDIRVVSSTKSSGGCLKVVEHWSSVNNCRMTFAIYLPEDNIKLMRREPYPAIYYCAGLTSTWELASAKLQFSRLCKKLQVAMVFPDTSPRGVDAECPEAGDSDWTVGYGAGHYCNATQAPWNKHFNMFDYVTKELPSLVEKYFHVCPQRRSITGYSMGGNGALICAAKEPHRYRSVTAFAPICRPSKSDKFCAKAFEKYLGSVEAGAAYSISDILEAKGRSLTLPPGFVDVASRDQFED